MCSIYCKNLEIIKYLKRDKLNMCQIKTKKRFYVYKIIDKFSILNIL